MASLSSRRHNSFRRAKYHSKRRMLRSLFGRGAKHKCSSMCGCVKEYGMNGNRF